MYKTTKSSIKWKSKGANTYACWVSVWLYREEFLADGIIYFIFSNNRLSCSNRLNFFHFSANPVSGVSVIYHLAPDAQTSSRLVCVCVIMAFCCVNPLHLTLECVLERSVLRVTAPVICTAIISHPEPTQPPNCSALITAVTRSRKFIWNVDL